MATLPVLAALQGFAQNNVYNIKIDLSDKKDSVKPIWAFFGYDEPNYTYMKDGRKLLTELSALSPVPVYVRADNLLTTGNGKPHLKWGSTNAYTEDATGNPVYNWHIPGRKVIVNEYRIDEEHSNSYTAWKKIGFPQQVSKEQYSILEKSGKLQLYQKPHYASIRNGVFNTNIHLPGHAVSLLKVSW